MSEKVTGYILVTVGLVMMFFALFSVYQVFTKKSQPPELFTLPGVSLDMSKFIGSDLSSEEQRLLQKQTGPLSTEIIDADLINKPLNIVAYVLFMGFLLNTGFKIASLGVQFVRPIKVNLKTESSGSGGGDKNG